MMTTHDACMMKQKVGREGLGGTDSAFLFMLLGGCNTVGFSYLEKFSGCHKKSNDFVIFLSFFFGRIDPGVSFFLSL